MVSGERRDASSKGMDHSMINSSYLSAVPKGPLLATTRGLSFFFVGIVKVSSVLRTTEGLNSSIKHSGVAGHDNLTFSRSYFLGLFGFAVAFVSVVHGLVVLSSVRANTSFSQFPWT